MVVEEVVWAVDLDMVVGLVLEEALGTVVVLVAALVEVMG